MCFIFIFLFAYLLKYKKCKYLNLSSYRLWHSFCTAELRLDEGKEDKLAFSCDSSIKPYLADSGKVRLFHSEKNWAQVHTDVVLDTACNSDRYRSRFLCELHGVSGDAIWAIDLYGSNCIAFTPKSCKTLFCLHQNQFHKSHCVLQSNSGCP